MTWHVLHYSQENPEQLYDPTDEWKSEWLGYFFVSDEEYDKYKKHSQSGEKIDGHLYSFADDKLERDEALTAVHLRKSQRYVDELPGDGVDDIHAWVDEHAHDYRRDKFSHMYMLIGDDAIAFFENHLVDDPHTEKMLENLETAEDRHRAWELRGLMEPAMFLRALDLCEVDLAEDLPFELPQSVCNTINGSKTKKAFRKHCESLDERLAAAALNMLDRWCRGKRTYDWTADVVDESMLSDDVFSLRTVVKS